ncbi:hypothetical protein [Trinickia acidisoli]|uniref:hypothetical protein n=1 Tax=Trinickia acidisoli TaxID=2767482 RepID=UPI001A8C5332|nr:hypothetical protein [Trinickia acidisoli]
MKIVGYGLLLTIAFALLVSMCAILKDGYVGSGDATDAVAGTSAAHAPPAPAPAASEPTARAALRSV